jgi:hypothetical protein
VERAVFAVFFLELLVFGPLEFTLWHPDLLPHLPEPENEILVQGLTVVLSVLAMVGALVLAPGLSRFVPAGKELRAWVRWGRWPGLALPVLRDILFSAYLWAVEARPGWLMKDALWPPLDLAHPSGRRRPEGAVRHALEELGTSITGHGLFLVVDLFIVSWWWLGTWDTVQGAWPIIAWRLVAATIAALAMRSEPSRPPLAPPWIWLQWLSLLCWLLPVPLLPLLWFLLRGVFRQLSCPFGIVGAAWGRTTERFRWLEVRTRSRAAPRPPHTVSHQAVVHDHLWRAKACALFPEAAWMMPLWIGPFHPILILMSVGIAWLSGASRGRAVTVLLLFVTGSYFGYVRGDPYEAAGLLMMVCTIAGLLGLARMVRSEVVDLVQSFSTMVWLCLAMLAGQVLRDSGAGASWVLVEAVFWIAPFFSIFVGALGVPWLVRPRHPSDVHRGSVPAAQRLAVILLLVTAILPLGGLFVPLWDTWRRRLVE